MYAYIYLCTCIIYIYIYIYTHTHTYTNTYTYTYIYIYVCVCMCVCAYYLSGPSPLGRSFAQGFSSADSSYRVAGSCVSPRFEDAHRRLQAQFQLSSRSRSRSSSSSRSSRSCLVSDIVDCCVAARRWPRYYMLLYHTIVCYSLLYGMIYHIILDYIRLQAFPGRG